MPQYVIDAYIKTFKIDTPEKKFSLLYAYGLTQKYVAPFIVKTTVDMLPSLISATRRNPDVRIIFVGRDAFSIGYVARALAPEFHSGFCRELYLSRSVVDAALRELEEEDRHRFAPIRHFRKSESVIPEWSTWEALNRYFAEHDIVLDQDGSEILLVDSGYKGSVQEMLSAAYPQTRFEGHYVFHAESPYDPHPGTKKGYALNLDVECGNEGQALRGPLPDSLELTFSHHEAILAIEELLQGSQLSPKEISPVGQPLTLRHSEAPYPIEGLNPVKIASEYTDPLLREAVLSINVQAVAEYARALRPHIRADDHMWYTKTRYTSWYMKLADYAALLPHHIRAWVDHRTTDPAFQRLLDSFIHRTDKDQVVAMASAMGNANISDKNKRNLWIEFDKCQSVLAKEQFVQRTMAELVMNSALNTWQV